MKNYKIIHLCKSHLYNVHTHRYNHVNKHNSTRQLIAIKLWLLSTL